MASLQAFDVTDLTPILRIGKEFLRLCSVQLRELPVLELWPAGLGLLRASQLGTGEGTAVKQLWLPEVDPWEIFVEAIAGDCGDGYG